MTRPMRSVVWAGRGRARKSVVAVAAAAGLVLAAVQVAPARAEAAGPPYSGPPTAATGPAYFGPAPNPFPYCENPTYFDPFPENVSPIGRIDVTGSPNAAVTNDAITMEFELTAEGDPGGQYPGFFPFGGDGSPGDQPKGVEMASDDGATIRLSEPLFYTQWVFTDVDRANEGFFVTPTWSDPGTPGQVGVFGGDANFDFTGTSPTVAVFNDTDTVAQDSEAIEGRVQVDFLGGLQEITILRDTGSGQSGFAIGGGCSPIGVAKEVTSGPNWNGTGFDVTYTIRVRNNLPSTTTLAADVAAAVAAAASGTSAGTPIGIDLVGLELDDLLTDAAFSSINVVSNTNTSGNVATNPGYDGQTDTDLILAGDAVPPETEEEFVVTVQYVPDGSGPVGATCGAPYQITNQATLSGVANGADVVDLSDEGLDPDPGVNNGGGSPDDPTIVTFPCPPLEDPVLQIVKTVVEAPAPCPPFAAGVPGDGPALSVAPGSTVTYCIAVGNSGLGAATSVVVTDPMAPPGFDGTIGDLAAGADDNSLSFDLVVDATTTVLNTATVNGAGPGGALLPVDDTALIEVSAIPLPAVSLTKTVVRAAEGCAAAVEGVDELVVGEAGDPIIWCFVVTNTGDVDLADIIFNDAPAALSNVDLLAVHGGGAASLAPASAISFELASSIPAGGLVNVATVDGAAANPDGTLIVGIPRVDDENDASVDAAALDLQKQVVAGAAGDCALAGELATVDLGDPVTYCFTVTNTGNVDVLITEIVDTTLGLVVPVPAADQILTPNDVVVVSIAAASTGDLVNTASTLGIPVDDTGAPIPGAPTLEPEDIAEVDTLSANISVVKTVGNPGPVLANTRVEYSLEIANAGPDPAQAVSLVDTLPTGLSLEILPEDPDWACTGGTDLTVLECAKATPLGVGESVTLTYFVRVGPTAPLAIDLVNTVVVTSTTPDPDPSDNTDTGITRRIELPPDETIPTIAFPPPTITNPPPNPPSVPNPVVAPPLATTGAPSTRLATGSTLLVMLGATLWVTGRRRSETLDLE